MTAFSLVSMGSFYRRLTTTNRETCDVHDTYACNFRH